MFALLLLTGLFANPLFAIDITPFGGSQGGGALRHIASEAMLHFEESPTRGVIFGWGIDHERELELLYQWQETTLRSDNSAIPEADLLTLEMHTLQLGGTVLSEERHHLRAFLSGGLGLTHYAPAASAASSETRPSLSLGIGAKWMPTRTLGVRLEARGYGTLFNSNTTLFCSGGCTIAVSGDLLSHYALFAGVVIRLE
ncbi:MAG: hypothetical protein OQL08_06325 [Gammaproteobacteria bacterium]|nr:hypothetical protein [Gammaproteobacteria bacterium]